MRLFEFSHRKNNIIYYKPTTDIYITSIDTKTGKVIKKSKIIWLTEHPNCNIWEVILPDNNTKFQVSDDHSLLVYNIETDKIEKLSPIQISKLNRKKLESLFLISENKYPKSILAKELLTKHPYNLILHNLRNLYLIPLSAVKLINTNTKDTLYDITVEDTETLKLTNGLFINDTMMQYFIHTSEAKKELDTKKIDSRTQLKYLRDDNWLHRLRHEFQYAIYVLTINPVILYNEEELKEKTIDLNTALELIDKANNYNNTEFLFTPVKISNTYYTLAQVLINKLLFSNFNILKEQKLLIDTQNIDKKNVTSVNNAIYKYLIEYENLNPEENPVKFGERYLDILHELILLITTLINFNYDLNPRFTEQDFKIIEEIDKELNLIPDEPILGSYLLNKLSQKLIQNISNNAKIPDRLNMIYLMHKSGARASKTQIEQIILSKGFFADSFNRIIPKFIKNNLIKGLTTDEIYISSHGTRKSEIDKIHYTKHSGRIQRTGYIQLSIISYDKNTEDCGSTLTFDIKVLNEKHAKSLIGRYIYDSSNNLIQITKDNYKDFIGKEIRLRSPLFCKCEDFKVCKTCGGYDTVKRKQLGIHAATNISERLTQLTLRVFHTSGRVELSNELFTELDNFSIRMKDNKHIDISNLTVEDISKIETIINKIVKKINPISTYQVSIDKTTGEIKHSGTLYNKDIITTLKNLERIYLSSSEGIDLHKLYYFIISELHSVSDIKSIFVETLLTPLFIHKETLKEYKENISEKNFHADIYKLSMRYRELSQNKISSKEIDFNEYIKLPLRGLEKIYSDNLLLLYEPNKQMILSLLTSNKKNNVTSAFDIIFDLSV